MPTPSRMISVADLAAQFNVTESTARRWCRLKHINAQKIGRDWFVSPRDARTFRPRKVGNPQWRRKK